MKRLPSAVLTLLLLYAIVVALQFFIGADSLYALLLAPLIVVRSVYWRVGLNRLLFIILLAGVPILLRGRIWNSCSTASGNGSAASGRGLSACGGICRSGFARFWASPSCWR